MLKYNIYFLENKFHSGNPEAVVAVLSITVAFPLIFGLMAFFLMKSLLFWLFLVVESALLFTFVKMLIKIMRKPDSSNYIAIYSSRWFASNTQTSKKQMGIYIYAYLLNEGSKHLPALPPQMVEAAQKQAEAIRDFSGTDPPFAVNEIGKGTLEESPDGYILKYSPLLAGQDLPVTRQIDIIGDGAFNPHSADVEADIRDPHVYVSHLTYVDQLKALAEHIYGHDIPPIPTHLKGSRLADLLLRAIYEDDAIMGGLNDAVITSIGNGDFSEDVFFEDAYEEDDLFR